MDINKTGDDALREIILFQNSITRNEADEASVRRRPSFLAAFAKVNTFVKAGEMIRIFVQDQGTRKILPRAYD
jgi:hypothetical protein